MDWSRRKCSGVGRHFEKESPVPRSVKIAISKVALKSPLRHEADCLDSLDRQNRRRHGEQCVEAGSPGGGAQDTNVRHSSLSGR